jgi:hypothetical protein
MTVAREIVKCKVDLVGVEGVRWDRGGTEPAGDYTFFYGNGTTNLHLVPIYTSTPPYAFMA